MSNTATLCAIFSFGLSGVSTYRCFDFGCVFTNSEPPPWPLSTRTAFQEGGDNDPVNQLAAYHVDISSPGFGIQEENHFPPAVRELFTGVADIRGGYLYGSGKPGLGIDINEEVAARNPLKPIQGGGVYSLDRAMDGSVVKP